MRRYDRGYMQKHVQDGLARFTAAITSNQPVGVHVAKQEVSVPYILIGEPPEDWKGVDLSHFGECTSCRMAKGAALERKGAVLDIDTRRHLFADGHAVGSMVNLTRFI